jgi:ribosome recycling factor
MKKEGTITEDEIKTSEKEVQDVTDKYIKQIDAIVTAKEKEIMHI